MDNQLRIYEVKHQWESYMFAYVLAENEEQAIDLSIDKFVEELGYSDHETDHANREYFKAKLVLDQLNKPALIKFYTE